MTSVDLDLLAASLRADSSDVGALIPVKSAPVQARVVAHIGRRRWGRLSASLLEIAEHVRTWTPEEIA